MFTLTWFGNSTVKISTPQIRVVFDPFITLNPNLPKLQPSDLEGVSAILVTHGHFDHTAHLLYFAKALNARIILPLEVFQILKGRFPLEKIHCQTPARGEPVSIESLKATLFSSRHIRFDLRLIVKTLLRSMLAPLSLFKILKIQLPEGRCVGWLIEYENQRVFHLGSLGLDPKESYPQGIDLLSLPLQGHSRIHEKAVEVIEKLEPQKVLIHHFDDGFPPISQPISTAPFVSLLGRRHPDLEVIVPEYGRPVTIRQ